MIAEDYDDQHPISDQDPDGPYDPADDTTGELAHETLACPNQSNPYHTCSDYCRQRWGVKKFRADVHMEKKRERLLRKYPVPETWLEVGDPDTSVPVSVLFCRSGSSYFFYFLQLG